MNTKLALIFGIFVLANQLHAQVSNPSGAWRQQSIAWGDAPPELEEDERQGQAAILYFGPDHQFALIYASVIQMPSKCIEHVSVGDGQVVYLGKWKLDSGGVSVNYQLVSRTIQIKGEHIPGAFVTGLIRFKNSTLSFQNETFERDRMLDEDVRTVVRSAEGILRVIH